MQCPVCQGKAKEIMPGTVQGAEFFGRSSDYVIAAGGKRDNLGLYRCVECGHGFSPTDFDPGLLKRWYERAPQDKSFISQKNARLKTAEVMLKRLEAVHPEKGQLVDIGCGPGLFLKAAKDRGWSVRGVELSDWAAAWASENLGIHEITRGDYSRLADWPAGSVDVVCTFDVIEHVIDLEDFITTIRRVLKPGGVLLLTTPRFDSAFARFWGQRWHAIHPAHLHYFSVNSLRRLLQRAGFKIEKRRAHTRYLSWRYFWQRLVAYLGLAEMTVVEKASLPIPINVGDEFEVYSRRK